VAKAVDVTTMALYRYVSGKESLVALMVDAVLVPDEATLSAAGSWRDRLEVWARAQLAVCHAHPWVPTVMAQPLGPNRLRWLESGLAALEGTGLSEQQAVAVVGMLSLHLLAEGQVLAAFAEQQAGRVTEPMHPALLDYAAILPQVATPEVHPRVIAALEAGAFDDPEPGADSQELADLALVVLLDGIERLVDRGIEGE
jgi:AcrR family transcriptional regulator